MKKRFLVFSSFVLFSLFSCSLKYGMTVQSEDNVPEFVFKDVDFSRYEDGNKTLSMNAETLEQYKGGKSMYAHDMEFSIYKNDEVTNSGKCGYLSADTDSERYVLYDDIEIDNKKDGVNVKAKSLKWNGKSEQLTSSRNDVVTIKKGDTILQGSGFSASAVSKKYVFNGVVTGVCETSSDSGEQSSGKEEAIPSKSGEGARK